MNLCETIPAFKYSVERIHEEYQCVPKELIEKVIKALKANRVIKLVH